MNMSMNIVPAYGFTSAGQSYQVYSGNGVKIIKTKPNPSFLLKALLCDIIQERIKLKEKQLALEKSVAWFEVGGGPDMITGSFNTALYEAVLLAKQEYIHDCVCCKDKFKPGFGVSIDHLKFCDKCLCDFKHFDYLRNEEQMKSDANIWILCQSMKSI